MRGFRPVLMLGVLLVPGICEASLEIGTGNAGVSVGNSKEWTGLRFNLVDRGVTRVDGVNFIVAGPDSEESNGSARYRGITLGLFSGIGHSFEGVAIALMVSAERVDGISISLAGQGRQRMAGINLGGMVGDFDDTRTNARIWGLTVGAMFVITPARVTGVTMAGLIAGGKGSLIGASMAPMVMANEIDGLALGLWEVTANTDRGLSMGLVDVRTRDLRGVGVSSLFLTSDDLRGVGASALVWTSSTAGLTIAIFNYAKALHGVQLGVLNFAGNNSSWTRWLPVANAHF